MHLLPQNPKTRQTVLIAVAAGAIMVGFGFFFVNYFTPATPEEIQRIQAEKSAQGQGVSEGAVKQIEGNITGLEKELENDFYATLKKHTAPSDAAPPGKQNPFAQ